MVLSGVPRKKSPVTPPGIDPGTVRLVAHRLNHYATLGPFIYTYIKLYYLSTAHILSYNDLLNYAVSIILIFYNFNKRNIKAPCRWCRSTKSCRSVCNTVCPTRYRTGHFFNNSNTNEERYCRSTFVVWEMKMNVSVVRFKFRCNILISGKIINEMPGSVASGTHCTI